MWFQSTNLAHAALCLLSLSTHGLSAVTTVSPPAGPQAPSPNTGSSCSVSRHRLMRRGPFFSTCMGRSGGNSEEVKETFPIDVTPYKELRPSLYTHDGVTFTFLRLENNYELRAEAIRTKIPNQSGKMATQLTEFEYSFHTRFGRSVSRHFGSGSLDLTQRPDASGKRPVWSNNIPLADLENFFRRMKPPYITVKYRRVYGTSTSSNAPTPAAGPTGPSNSQSGRAAAVRDNSRSVNSKE